MMPGNSALKDLISARRCLIDFVNSYGARIVSDGDLDGIFATGLLLLVFRTEDIRECVKFPHPNDLAGLKVRNSILVELPLTKGLTYVDQNVLIDHHPDPPRVEYYEGNNIVNSFIVSGARSVASLVYTIFRDTLKLSNTAREIISAIDNIDNGYYAGRLDRILHSAYLINKTDDNMRYSLLDMIIRRDWEGILE